MDVVVWALQILFVVISLGFCVAGVLVLLGKRVMGVPRFYSGTATTVVGRFIRNGRVLGAVWVGIGLFGLLMGATSMTAR
ncbi:hypothetical protein GCM10009601_63060 [Streptomyces thermospinosisporus]|uniref:Uncharacterized protein n=1 Tax=Streptomyces thermospinosisporus TaxID=161482 RepID=A0ABP4K0M3_9ACTN